MTAAVVMDVRVGTPDWWLARLYKALVARRPVIDLYDAYYTGNHPLPWLHPKAREEFRQVLKMTRSNFMGLVCDAVAELSRIEGFRLGSDPDGSADSKTWDLWQTNKLDMAYDLGLLESLIGGNSYGMVEPNRLNPKLPKMHIEHASQVIMDFFPGTNRQVAAAALKVYDDDWTGQVHATMQVKMPDNYVYIFKWQAAKPQGTPTTATPIWTRREVPGEPWGVRSPYDQVSFFEFPNNPRLLTGGRSEIEDVIDVQDRVNKTIADRLITQDFGAWPQWWAVAYPTEDAQGRPVEPVDIGRDRMITTDVAETKFGQFSVAQLDPYSAAKREDVRDIAARTRTPADYLLGELVNVNGETLKASRAGIVAKTKQRHRSWGEPTEAFVNFGRQVAGLPDIGATRLEVIWADPEFRTEGERTDATIKKLGAGIIDLQQAQEDSGYTATQIERMNERRSLEQEQDPVLRAARQLTTGADPAGG